jgi:3-phosphoshikimate 1-carboxyvinyltransferase
MGARIAGRLAGRCAPLTFLPGDGTLRGGDHHLEVASAQVKSALLLAALRASTTGAPVGTHRFPRPHRAAFPALLDLPLRHPAGLPRRWSPAGGCPPSRLEVPGDISSAAFFLAAALIGGA